MYLHYFLCRFCRICGEERSFNSEKELLGHIEVTL